MESQSNAIDSSRASYAIREGSVNSMKVDYLFQYAPFLHRRLHLPA
jgi:hypothetical protein